MGLDQASCRAERSILRRNTDWRVPLFFSVFSALATLPGSPARVLLRYDRSGIADGEWWRLVTGHFAHLGISHLVLNVAGLAVVWILVGSGYRGRQWLLISLASIVVMDLAFWVLSPELAWYVGMSGLLHGLLAAGVLQRWRETPGESMVIAAVVAAKLAYEQIAGPLPGSEHSAGGSVVVDSHLYGAIGGLLAAAVLLGRAAIMRHLQGANS